MTIQQMREKRQALAKEIRDLLDNNPGAKWKENPENQTKYDRLSAEIADLDGEIKRHTDQLEREAANFASNVAHGTVTTIDRDDPEAEHKRIFNKWMRGGDRALNREEVDFLARRVASGPQNTLSTTVPAEGGHTVPTTTAGQIIAALKAFGGIREAATVFSTAGGEAMNWPTGNATAEEGEIVGQNAPAAKLDPSFGVKSIGAFWYSSKEIAVPRELLQDSAIDMEAYLVSVLNQRIGRITTKHFTTGTGVGQPEGLVTASTQGVQGANGQTTTVTYDDIIKLIHSVDPAYRGPNCRLMMHDSTLLALRLLKDGQQRPLWQPAITENEPDRIAGYGYIINQHMPVMAANAKSILFGDFSRYYIRDVMQVQLFRMEDSNFIRNHQVGFLAFSRHDGKLMDVGGAVKHYANAAA